MTVIVAVPEATPSTVIAVAEPVEGSSCDETVATVVSDDEALSVSASPSASANTPDRSMVASMPAVSEPTSPLMVSRPSPGTTVTLFGASAARADPAVPAAAAP